MIRVLAAVAISSLLAAQEGQPAAGKVDFQKQVAPILMERCIECHGPKAQKGDLRLDAKAHLFAGDQDEWNVVPGKPDDSELLRRLGLPVGDDEIMPEKGEPLNKDQQALIQQWIAEGAEWPAAADEWFAKSIAAQAIPKITFELPEVGSGEQAAIDAAVAEWKQRGAVVQQVAADTPAIDVNLSLLRDKVTDADLALLAPLQKRLVWLNLSRTAVSDAGRARGEAAVAGRSRRLRRGAARGSAERDRRPRRAQQAGQRRLPGGRQAGRSEPDRRARRPPHRVLLRQVQGGVREGTGEVPRQAAAEEVRPAAPERAAPEAGTRRAPVISGGGGRPGRARGRASSPPAWRGGRRRPRSRS